MLNASKTKLDSLGRSFHVFGEDGAVQYQGAVVAQIGPEHYLVRYFDWILGQESTFAVVPVSEMACPPKNSRAPWSWQFYVDDAHMNEWYTERGEGLKRLAEDRREQAQRENEQASRWTEDVPEDA